MTRIFLPELGKIDMLIIVLVNSDDLSRCSVASNPACNKLASTGCCLMTRTENGDLTL